MNKELVSEMLLTLGFEEVPVERAKFMKWLPELTNVVQVFTEGGGNTVCVRKVAVLLFACGGVEIATRYEDWDCEGDLAIERIERSSVKDELDLLRKRNRFWSRD